MSKYLFVSEKCSHCKDFIDMCQQNAELCEDIQLVSVEDNRGNLPTFLKKVPTLETSAKIYHGQEVFGWLEELIESKKSEDISPAENFATSFCSVGDHDVLYQVSNKYSGIGEKQGSEGVSESDFVESPNTIDVSNLDRLTQQRKIDLETITQQQK